jgi:hypothetical protein
MVYIIDGSVGHQVELATEDDELDFARGRFPIAHRKIKAKADSDDHQPRHLKWRKLKPEEDPTVFPAGWLRHEGKTTFVATHVPTEYEGLKEGDQVAMLLGGSGDRLAYALSRFGEPIGATVYRLSPFIFKPERGEGAKVDDAKLLAMVFLNDPGQFHLVVPRDRNVIEVTEAYRARSFTQRDRIACVQRLRQQAIGRAFIDSKGGYPEGTIEETYDQLRASSVILEQLCQEEKLREAELKKAVHQAPIWQAYLHDIKGCGEVAAGGLIAAVQDIRRFIVEPDPAKVQGLREERDRLLIAGRFEADLVRIQDRITESTSYFQKVQMVRSWKEANGQVAEAQLLDQAIDHMRQRHRLNRDATRRTVNRVVAFCGVHVRQGGRYADVPPSHSFPRLRSGEMANYSPIARQALYNLVKEQFVQRKKTVWGQRLLQNKARLQAIHPEPVVNDSGANQWTKGHIHRTAIWRTATQFVREKTRAWLRIERSVSHQTTTEEPVIETE